MAPTEAYNYMVATRVLNESDKNRILCCFLHSADSNAQVNWQAASDAFGSASMASFKKMVSNALKKVKEAEILGDAGIAVAEAKVSKGSQAVGKKRKARADEEEGVQGAAAATEGKGAVPVVVEAPPSKKKGRKARNEDIVDDNAPFKIKKERKTSDVMIAPGVTEQEQEQEQDEAASASVEEGTFHWDDD